MPYSSLQSLIPRTEEELIAALTQAPQPETKEAKPPPERPKAPEYTAPEKEKVPWWRKLLEASIAGVAAYSGNRDAVRMIADHQARRRGAYREEEAQARSEFERERAQYEEEEKDWREYGQSLTKAALQNSRPVSVTPEMESYGIRQEDLDAAQAMTHAEEQDEILSYRNSPTYQAYLKSEAARKLGQEKASQEQRQSISKLHTADMIASDLMRDPTKAAAGSRRMTPGEHAANRLAVLEAEGGYWTKQGGKDLTAKQSAEMLSKLTARAGTMEDVENRSMYLERLQDWNELTYGQKVQLIAELTAAEQEELRRGQMLRRSGTASDTKIPGFDD
jgi:hypothetical protein